MATKRKRGGGGKSGMAARRPSPARKRSTGRRTARAIQRPAPESLAAVRIAVTTIGDLLLTGADRYPNDDALVFTHKKLTYAELAARAIERARALQALGVKPRDHVGLLLPSCIEFVEYFFGAALCGAVVVPINARYKPHELTYVIENGDLVTIVTTGAVPDQVDFVARLRSALPSLHGQTDPTQLALAEAPKLRNIVLLGTRTDPAFVAAKSLRALAKRTPVEAVHRARLRTRVRDVGLMLYTSGTTANPKGCLITHEAMVRNSIALGRHRYQLKHGDRFWSPLPMFHIAAILPLIAILDVGGAYMTMGYFDAGQALEMLEKIRSMRPYLSRAWVRPARLRHSSSFLPASSSSVPIRFS